MEHKITRIALIGGDGGNGFTDGGINWECECGSTGTCPRPIAAWTLARHLAGDD